jgi:hypothetical protein
MIPKPHICNRGALAVSFETQPTFRTTGDGKDGNPTYFDPTTRRRRLDAWFSGFVNVRDVGVLIY